MIKFFSNYKIFFYSINFSLIFLYLFPGSLIGYVFYGSKTSKNLQIGNAVPIHLAKAIGKELYKSLKG